MSTGTLNADLVRFLTQQVVPGECRPRTEYACTACASGAKRVRTLIEHERIYPRKTPEYKCISPSELTGFSFKAAAVVHILLSPSLSMSNT